MLSAFFCSTQINDPLIEGLIAASVILNCPIENESFAKEFTAISRSCREELANLPAEFSREICVQVLFNLQDQIFTEETQ